MTTQQPRKQAQLTVGKAYTKNEKTRKSKRARTLLVARESGKGAAAKNLLEQLFYTLVRNLKDRQIDLPDFGNVIEIYDDPTLADTEVFRRPGMKAVLIKGRKYDLLLSLGSARKLNSRGDNYFIATLVDVLDAGGYDSVMTTSLSRICRNRLAATDLEKVLSRNRTTLLAGNHEIRVWEKSGSFMWMILTWFATLEAEQIEARLTAAKMTKAGLGVWSFGFAPPPGWKRLADGTVEVDEEVADAVRWLIRQVRAERSDWRQMAREAIQRWPDLPSRRGGGLVANQQEPGTALRRTYLNRQWFEAYLTNRHLITMVPDAVKQDLEWAAARGQESEPDPEDAPSVVFELPAPIEPLATPEEIEALEGYLARIDGTRPSRRRAGTVLFSGLSWAAEEVSIEGSILQRILGQDRPKEAA